jgi:hypothetical protein
MPASTSTDRCPWPIPGADACTWQRAARPRFLIPAVDATKQAGERIGYQAIYHHLLTLWQRPGLAGQISALELQLRFTRSKLPTCIPTRQRQPWRNLLETG